MAKLRGMQLGDLRSAIDSWKQSEFKDVGELRAILTDKTATTAKRDLARQELIRQGWIGVTPAEQKIGDLQKQMEEGDTVTIGNETFTVEELFSDPEKLLQIQTWVDNPETAPPEIKTWLEQNKDAINLKMGELTGAGATGLTGMYQRIKQNQETFALDPSIEKLMSKDTMETFLPDLAEIGLDDVMPLEDESNEDYKAIQDDHAAKVAAINADTTLDEKQKAAKIKELDAARDAALEDKFGDYRKYKFLQSPETAQNAMLLMNNLQTIPGVDGKEIFGQLTSAQMAQIFARGEYGVNDFIQGLKDRQRVSSFDGTNFKNEFEVLARDLGVGSTAGQLANLMDKDLSPYKAILEKAGLKLKDGKLDVTQLRGMIDGLKNSDLQGLIGGSARSMKEALSKLATKLDNEIGRGPELQTELGSDKEREEAFYKANPTAPQPYEKEEARRNTEFSTQMADWNGGREEWSRTIQRFPAFISEGKRLKMKNVDGRMVPVFDDGHFTYERDVGGKPPTENEVREAVYAIYSTQKISQKELASKIQVALAQRREYAAAFNKRVELRNKFERARDDMYWLRDNRGQYIEDLQNRRSDWYNNTYLVDMRKNNQEMQKVYSDLADLFGGLS